MRTRLQKWGDDLAVRIPKGFAEDARLVENGVVDVMHRDGKLIVAPVAEPEYSLDDLISRINDDNRHGETETGAPVGRELW